VTREETQAKWLMVDAESYSRAAAVDLITGRVSPTCNVNRCDTVAWLKLTKLWRQ